MKEPALSKRLNKHNLPSTSVIAYHWEKFLRDQQDVRPHILQVITWS